MRAFFCHGTFHQEHEEGKRGGEDAEDEEAVEISECGRLLLPQVVQSCNAIWCAATGSPVCWRQAGLDLRRKEFTAGLNGSRFSPRRKLWNWSRRS